MLEKIITSTLVFIGGAGIGVTAGLIIGYQKGVEMVSKVARATKGSNTEIKDVAGRMAGAPRTKAQFFPKLSNTEAMKMEENSAKKHSDLVVLPDDETEEDER